MSKNGRFHCTECNKNFSCLVGTIFEHTPMPSWTKVEEALKNGMVGNEDEDW